MESNIVKTNNQKNIANAPIQTDVKTVLEIIEKKNINYILDSTDVSKILGLSVRTVRNYLSKNRIKNKKIGKKYFVLYSDLVNFISA